MPLGSDIGMDKDSLTDTQRESLRYYVDTRHQDISAAFAFRFYARRVIVWAIISASLSLFAWLVVPSEAKIPMRLSIVAICGAMFSTLMLYTFWISNASVEHWRLLRAIIDWKVVARLVGDETIGEPKRDGNSD
jgi:hypothetical protein